MRPIPLALLMLLAAGTAGSAQPGQKPDAKSVSQLPVEDVTISAARTRQAIAGFVQALAAPTRATDKIARWQDPICPTLVGLKPGFARFIIGRVKQVATQAGAPVSASPSCAPNIAIVFTTTPQALLDNIKAKQPASLGYYDTIAQRDALATVAHPIQAWYTTATRDLRGHVELDSGRTVGTGVEISFCRNDAGCVMHLPNAHAASVSETRLGDGTSSTLDNVIIVADPTRLTEYEMGTLSDYIAMLALAQVHAGDNCQTLPSILNLLAKDCAPVTALTANDLGYLGALYKMSPERTLQVQRDEIGYQMQRALGVP